jgi:hypothetical protein
MKLEIIHSTPPTPPNVGGALLYQDWLRQLDISGSPALGRLTASLRNSARATLDPAEPPQRLAGV